MLPYVSAVSVQVVPVSPNAATVSAVVLVLTPDSVIVALVTEPVIDVRSNFRNVYRVVVPPLMFLTSMVVAVP